MKCVQLAVRTHCEGVRVTRAAMAHLVRVRVRVGVRVGVRVRVRVRLRVRGGLGARGAVHQQRVAAARPAASRGRALHSLPTWLGSRVRVRHLP